MSLEQHLRMAAIALVLAANAAGAAEPSGEQQKDAEDDAFSVFHSNKKAKSAPPAEGGETQPRAKAAPKPTASSGGTLSIYCSGTAQQYTGPMPTFSDTFEFRTKLDFGAGKHQVVNVLKGKIFRSGATYDLLKLPNDVVVLSAESVEPKWKISTVKLDMAASRLTGEGTVDLSALRARIRGRMNEMSPSSGDSIPQGGLDDSRSVKIDGNCQPL